MRTRIITTSVWLGITVGFGFLSWLVGEGLPGRLLAIVAGLCGLILIFDGFHTLGAIMSAMTGSEPDETQPQNPPTDRPAPGSAVPPRSTSGKRAA